MFFPSSHESESQVLSSNTICKRGNWSKCGLRTGKHINTSVKGRLPDGKLSEKMNNYHCPENCESLTKVCVNQAVWDNLSPSVHVSSQYVKIQKVRLFKGLEMINKLVEQIVPQPVGRELLQEAVDALALLANANS